ncbi:Amino acid export carrier protein [Rhodococcus sp. RD6.2]|uniref:threonine/serine ThrE exporter family protein n=1 Tax=Rhodococcus sp. RD6.2 TaxID=260936 RepID=UPI00063B5F1E|nr:threonine/serine exporter family protein [Rhodococcus sp. RD6.2]CRK53388.1 Amino acid export carrier protein [Rhodococcus sp. RD6.2]
MAWWQSAVTTLGKLVGERAVVDEPVAAPTPLQPIDLTEDARVAQVLDLAVRSGEVLLAAGTSAVDTAAQVQFVAATYGLARCDVDVTYNSIRVSAYRGPTMPPATSMRIVHYRSLDFTRLAAVDKLTRQLRTEAIDPVIALAEISAITHSPHPYNRWVATIAWSGMAASVAVLLGGGVLVALVSLLTTAVIYLVNLTLNRFGLPYFFQQVVGGFIAATPAGILYALREPLALDVKPSLVIAAGLTVLLSGLALVGSVQDAITGAPVTGVARFFEVLMLTGGMIAGVALSLRIAAALGTPLPLTVPSQFSTSLTELPVQVVAGAATALFFALACYAERRAVVVAALSGAAGILVLNLGLAMSIGPVVGTAIAATVVGFVGGLLARRALTPPLVIAVSGITPLLPGLSLYRGLYALLNDELLLGISGMMSAFGIGVALAAGVTLGEWGARTVRRPRMLRKTEALRYPFLQRMQNGPGARNLWFRR